MILTGREIRKEMQAGKIVIRPDDDLRIGPNSVDVRLGDKLYIYNIVDYPYVGQYILDSRNVPPLRELPKYNEGWLLKPGELYLGSTLEYTETHGFVPYLDGRSSLGRLGVFAHVTAGRGDDGFCGHWTVEIVAARPVVIYPRERYFQITYHEIRGERDPYNGRYQGDSRAVGSRINQKKA